MLGVGDLLYDGPDEFGEIVAHNENRPVRLYVYSTRSEEVREVIITPDRQWGGDGCLGCGVGAGYLHTLPPRRDLHKPVARLAAPPPAAAATTAAATAAAPPVAAAADAVAGAAPPAAAPPQPVAAELPAAAELFAASPACADGSAALPPLAPPPSATGD